MTHDDDYSDLLSAEEKAELEEAARERERVKEWATTQLSIPEELTRQEYTADFLKESRDFVFSAETFNRLMYGRFDISSAKMTPDDMAKAEQAFNNTLAGNDALRVQARYLQPHIGACVIPEEETVRPSWMPESLQALQAMIRQIVREEIERYNSEQYRRATRRPTHGFWEGATFHADGDTSDPKSRK